MKQKEIELEDYKEKYRLLKTHCADIECHLGDSKNRSLYWEGEYNKLNSNAKDSGKAGLRAEEKSAFKSIIADLTKKFDDAFRKNEEYRVEADSLGENLKME